MTSIPHDSSKAHARRPEQVIFFVVSGQTFAIAAESVKEIRSTDSLAGAAVELECPEVPKIRHFVERAHRAFYVVNGCDHFHLPATRPSFALVLRQFRIVLLVDSVERIAGISAVYPLPLAFSGEERIWYRGLAYIEDRITPVIQPAGFLSREQLEYLDRIAPRARSPQHAEGVVPA
jgi:chemotaxis signal transduction protein